MECTQKQKCWKNHFLLEVRKTNQKIQEDFHSRSLYFHSRSLYFSFKKDPLGIHFKEKKTHAELFFETWKKAWQQSLDDKTIYCYQSDLKEQFYTFFNALMDPKKISQELSIDLILKIKEQFTQETNISLNEILKSEHIEKIEKISNQYPKFRLVLIMRRAFCSAEQKYKDKINEINKQNSFYGFCLPNALRSHGSYGEQRVDQFIESIRTEFVMSVFNDKICTFFNNGGGIRDHSFISFVLNELKDLPDELCKQISLSPILLHQDERDFHDAALLGLRTRAMHILKTQPFIR